MSFLWKVREGWGIVVSQPTPYQGLRVLWLVFSQIWFFDMVRPGIRTGFQLKSKMLHDKYMWYSPVETRTCRQMVSFAKDWIRSYFEYSESNAVPVFVDLGSGAGKANLIALELGFPFSVGVEVDEDLVMLANRNFEVAKRSRRSTGLGFAFKGDVTNVADLRRLQTEVLNRVDGKPIWVFFNKNSYGSSQLEQSAEALNDLFGNYVYLYQNPVHEKVLLNKGFFVHRRVLDPRLRKNRDWIIVTPAPS